MTFRHTTESNPCAGSIAYTKSRHDECDPPTDGMTSALTTHTT
jgi:hypothetical protein